MIVTLVARIWGIFDLVVFNVNWGSCIALVSKWTVTQKWLVTE